MNKLSRLIAVIFLLAISYPSYSINSNKALKIFRGEIHNIKLSLKTGKLKPGQALVLLSAIQAREGEVIIAQNQMIINQYKALSQLYKRDAK